jgi:trk system potassium uptake protein TrkA
VGRRIEEIDLPKGATIGAIVRGGEVIMGHHDTLVEAEDHVIVFVIDKSTVKKVEKLFQVNIGFF